jgi:hypothetical protein
MSLPLHKYDDETAATVKRSIQRHFFNDAQTCQLFFEILKQTNSVIAGGSILQSIQYGELPIGDLDIYTREKGARALVHFFSTHFNVRRSNQQTTPAYDDSFLRSNHIDTRLYLSMDDDKDVDIMIVDDAYDINSVVTNFDLTFCQVCFDGENVFATHPEHIKNRQGKLNDGYLKSFLNGNQFILNRIKKYKARGYTVHFNFKTLEDDIAIGEKRRKNAVSLEEWIVKKIYNHLVDDIHHSTKIPSVYLYLDLFHTKIYTIDSLITLLQTLHKNNMLPGHYYYMAGKNGEVISWVLINTMSDMNPFRLRNKTYRNYASDFFIKYTGIQNAKEFDDKIRYIQKAKKAYRLDDDVRKFYRLTARKQLLKKTLERLREHSLRVPKARSFQHIHKFVRPAPIGKMSFPDTSKASCTDIEYNCVYDINSYIKGEQTTCYNENGEAEHEYDIKAVSKEEARDRLVFFQMKKHQDGYHASPYCYSLRMIEENLKTELYGKCRDNRFVNKQAIMEDPIIKLNFSDGPVYVKVDELLGAIHNTQKQVFLLFPTDETYQRTFSFGALIDQHYVSSDHCQEGTAKHIHRVVECDGKDGNVCYPIVEDNEITLVADYLVNDFSDDVFSTIVNDYKQHKLNVFKNDINDVEDLINMLTPYVAKRLYYDPERDMSINYLHLRLRDQEQKRIQRELDEDEQRRMSERIANDDDEERRRTERERDVDEIARTEFSPAGYERFRRERLRERQPELFPDEPDVGFDFGDESF